MKLIPLPFPGNLFIRFIIRRLLKIKVMNFTLELIKCITKLYFLVFYFVCIIQLMDHGIQSLFLVGVEESVRPYKEASTFV